MKWEIRNRNKTCINCEKIFVDSDHYHCLLFHNNEDELERADYCNECWKEKQPRKNLKNQVTSYWRGYIKPEVVIEKQDAILKNTAESLLCKYLHSKEPAERNVCYILALMLERKKILVHRDSLQQDNSENKLLIYEHTRTQDAFVIEDPQLSLDRLEHVQKQVQELLDAEAEAAMQEENAEDSENAENAAPETAENTVTDTETQQTGQNTDSGNTTEAPAESNSTQNESETKEATPVPADTEIVGTT